MTTTTTHCQVCGRPIKANTGVVAHHGYKRPGHGWQTASCQGAKAVPYEVGHDALDYWIALLNKYIPATEAKLADLLANPPAEASISRRDAYGKERPGYPKIVAKPEGWTFANYPSYIPDTFDIAMRNRERALRKDLREMRETLAYATDRRAKWVAPAAIETAGA